MATNTTKLALIKPDFVDVVDVADLNSNADKIDAAAGFRLVTSTTRPSTPWAGQAIFETDTDLAFVWDGTAWMPSGGGGSIEISATAPSSPGEGDLWWDSDNGKLYIYYNDGTSSQWVDAAGPSVAVQSTAPTGYEGQLWLDDTDGSMYVYYTDPGGANSQWIGAVSRSGGILQVVSTTKTDAFSTASTTFTDVTGLSATITPRSTSSKIYVMATVTGTGTAANTQIHLQLVRDSTAIFIGDAAGSRTRATVSGTEGISNEVYSMAASGLDSPATTSSVTYKVQAKTQGSSTVYINRSQGDSDLVSRPRTVSTITLIEVAG